MTNDELFAAFYLCLGNLPPSPVWDDPAVKKYFNEFNVLVNSTLDATGLPSGAFTNASERQMLFSRYVQWIRKTQWQRDPHNPTKELTGPPVDNPTP